MDLLRRDAVVGIEADVTADRHIKRLGITCALCHSTVDNSVAPGIGRRLDGLPNRDLNVGAIVALSPAVPASAKTVYKTVPVFRTSSSTLTSQQSSMSVGQMPA